MIKFKKPTMFINAIEGYDETLNLIKSIKADGHIDLWKIESFKHHQHNVVFKLKIERVPEKIRKSNKWRYKMAMKFKYVNGKWYTYNYEDIYLSKLIKTNLDIIKTRLRQSHQEERI